ncbi:MAG: ankyrin repeat domain-containing protein [Candidatus Dependentiae bacterium]|nr:ankyrin repeat domain-containing protein [Candidatus Dependentiae bacterium]
MKNMVRRMLVVGLLLSSCVAHESIARSEYKKKTKDSADVRLLKAAELGDVKAMRKALKAGASLEARKAKEDNRTALMLAALKKHHEAVDFLIEQGADVNAVDAYGCSALVKAGYIGDAYIVDALLKADACVACVNKYGETALMNAAEYGHVAAVKRLLKAGANPAAKTDKGKTALDLAKDPAIITLLQKSN